MKKLFIFLFKRVVSLFLSPPAILEAHFHTCPSVYLTPLYQVNFAMNPQDLQDGLNALLPHRPHLLGPGRYVTRTGFAVVLHTLPTAAPPNLAAPVVFSPDAVTQTLNANARHVAAPPPDYLSPETVHAATNEVWAGAVMRSTGSPHINVINAHMWDGLGHVICPTSNPHGHILQWDAHQPSKSGLQRAFGKDGAAHALHILKRSPGALYDLWRDRVGTEQERPRYLYQIQLELIAHIVAPGLPLPTEPSQQPDGTLATLWGKGGHHLSFIHGRWTCR